MKNHPFLTLGLILCLAALTGCAATPPTDAPEQIGIMVEGEDGQVDLGGTDVEAEAETVLYSRRFASLPDGTFDRVRTVEQEREYRKWRDSLRDARGRVAVGGARVIRPLVAIEVTVDLPLRYIPRLVRRVEVQGIPALHRAHPALEFARNLYTIDPERTVAFPSPPDNALGSSRSFLFQWRSSNRGYSSPLGTLPEDKTWLPSQDVVDLLEGRADGEIWLFPSPEYSEEDVANLFPFQAEYFFEEEDWNDHSDLHNAWNAAPIPAGVLRYPFETNQPTRLRTYEYVPFDHTASLQATLPPGVFVRIGATMDPSAKKSTAAK